MIIKIITTICYVTNIRIITSWILLSTVKEWDQLFLFQKLLVCIISSWRIATSLVEYYIIFKGKKGMKNIVGWCFKKQLVYGHYLLGKRISVHSGCVAILKSCQDFWHFILRSWLKPWLLHRSMKLCWKRWGFTFAESAEIAWTLLKVQIIRYDCKF